MSEAEKRKMRDYEMHYDHFKTQFLPMIREVGRRLVNRNTDYHAKPIKDIKIQFFKHLNTLNIHLYNSKSKDYFWDRFLNDMQEEGIHFINNIPERRNLMQRRPPYIIDVSESPEDLPVDLTESPPEMLFPPPLRSTPEMPFPPPRRSTTPDLKMPELGPIGYDSSSSSARTPLGPIGWDARSSRFSPSPRRDRSYRKRGPLQAYNRHFANLEMDNEIQPAMHETLRPVWRKMTKKQKAEWQDAMVQNDEGRTLRLQSLDTPEPTRKQRKHRG